MYVNKERKSVIQLLQLQTHKNTNFFENEMKIIREGQVDILAYAVPTVYYLHRVITTLKGLGHET